MTADLQANRSPATDLTEPPRIAVIGAGVAGAACAAGLLRAGFDVTVFDKSRGVGGRMATRRAQWADADGELHMAEFDHGCAQFSVTRPRFRTVVDRAEKFGSIARWRQRVYAAFPARQVRDVVVPTPNMPAFCRHLLTGTPLRVGRAVTGLRRCADGWHLLFTGDDAGITANGGSEGPFDQVLLAIPPAQAATLLSAHRDDWAGELATVRMTTCWTLMAVTEELDWPWDAAVPERGVLAMIVRNDRKPGRTAAANRARSGGAQWVAHATPVWSQAHLEDDPAQISEILRAALGQLLTGGPAPHWHHASVHRWRYAQLSQTASGSFDCWLDSRLGLGVCGDSFGDGSVEAAWRSGDELADAVAASFDATTAPDLAAKMQLEPGVTDPAH
jgi:predicted NAD/FAD-dependent oxidoreductase